MQIKHGIKNDTKNFQVTFVLQAHCIPSRYQRRATGWRPLWNAEWSTINEARISLSERRKVCTRWDGLRIIKRVQHNGAVREAVVS